MFLLLSLKSIYSRNIDSFTLNKNLSIYYFNPDASHLLPSTNAHSDPL